MQDLIAASVFVVAVYCAWAIGAYQSRKDAPPNVQQTVEPTHQEGKPTAKEDRPVVEPMPKQGFCVASQPSVDGSQPVAPTTLQPLPRDLSTQTIRVLKGLARGRIKNYGRLTKLELIKRLSACKTNAG